MDIRFCDDLGDNGFSWLVEEPMTRTSHALVTAGKVWLVDPVDWPEAIARAASLGEPAGVLQLLDRHDRDCGAIAERLGLPHLTVPPQVPGAPFDLVELRHSKRWHEVALWWEAARTLVVAEAVATNPFFTGGAAELGVHPLLRFRPPRALTAFEPEHLLVGHGEGLHGAAATDGLRTAIAQSRRGLPRLLLKAPALALDARRRRRRRAAP